MRHNLRSRLAFVMMIVVGLTAMVATAALADSSGPRNAGTGTSVSAGSGTSAWTNPGNITTVGSPYATVNLPSGGTTQYLQGTNYGFTIPAGATINGITVVINRQSNSFFITDSTVRLLKAGALVGSNLASGTTWPTNSFATATYGDTANLWGTTWTPADINNTNFGVALSAVSSSPLSRTLDVDYIQVTVTYSVNNTTTGVSCGGGTPVVTYGSSITCVATVTRSSGTNTPTGNVSWTTSGSGNFVTSPCTLSGSGASATCSVTYTPSSVGTGTHVITATYAGDTNFAGSNGSQSVTVNKKAASVTPNAASKTYGDPDPTFTGTLSGFLVADGVSATYSRTAGETVAGSPYTITATLSPAGVLNNYTITYNTANFTINKKAASVTPNATSKTYGDPDPTFTGTLSGFLVADGVSATYSRTAGEIVAGSPYTISATLSPAGVLNNYTITYNTANFTIDPASSTTTITCPANVTYDGTAQTPCSASITGAGGLSQSLTVTYTNNTNAGTATANASFAGDANHSPSSDSKTFTIDKASSVTIVTCSTSEVYTGSAIEPCTASVTGVGGLNLTPDPVYADNIIVGTATASYTYAGDANHSGSNGSDTFDITPASSTTTVTCPTNVTYDGSAQTPCSATVTGAGGLNQSLTVTYTNNINAGTATANASFAGDANHSPSSDSKTFTIDPKAASVTPNATSKTYGDPDPTFSGTLTGFLASDGVTATYSRTAGETVASSPYTISATLSPASVLSNYTITYNTANFTIDPASSITTITCPTNVTYDGSAQTPCSASVTGAGGLNQSLTVTYTNNINAGTATANASYAGDANHSPSSDSKTFTIDPASSTTTVTCPVSATYTSSAIEPCVVSVTGAGGLNLTPDPVYTDNIVVGTATASYTYAGDANHDGSSDSDTFDITPASSVTTVTCPASATYTGSAIEPCIVSVTGAGGLNLTPDPIYADNIVVGTATASYTYAGDANHSGSNGSDTFDITPASSTTTVICPASVTYDGTAQTPCSATVTGAGGLNQSLTVTYTDNTDVGTATANASFAGDANHSASSDSKTFTIDPASSTTIVTCQANVTYDGSAQTPCSATMTGAGGLNQSLTVTYTDNTDVGTATASASFAGDANHSASSDSKTFIIDKASSVTTVTCSTSEVYTGSAIEPCTVSVTGAGGLNLTPDPIYTDNIVVGTATASYTYAGDANHDGSNDSDTFEITTKNLTVTGIAADDKPYDGNTTATLTTNSAALVGVVPGDDVTLDDSGAVGTFASPNVGTWTVTISGLALTDADSNNYTLTQPTTTASITGASLTVDGITADDKLYDGNTSATLNTTGAVLVGVVPGDDVTLDDSGAVGTFADPNVGSWTVTISGLTLTGTDAGKYGLTQPTTTANITTKPITVTANSGQSKVYGTVDPVFTYTHDPLVGTDSFSGALSRVAGENVGAYAITQGNLSAGDNYSITFVPTNFSIIKANTSISLTSSLNPAVVGTSVTFTVTVTPTAATGTVQFYADNLALGSAVTLSSGTVTISTTTLSAGTHAITATYSGNSNFNTNTSASLEQTVAAAADDTRKTYLPVVLR